MKILKCIKTVYPVGQTAQLVTHFAYGRRTYPGYGVADCDNIDLAIFEKIEQFSKRRVNGDSQSQWYLSELDQGWTHYSATNFQVMHLHPVWIWINPTLPQGLVDTELVDQTKLQQLRVQANWVNHKPAGQKDLSVLPKFIDFSLQYDLLHQLRGTIEKPF